MTIRKLQFKMHEWELLLTIDVVASVGVDGTHYLHLLLTTKHIYIF